MISTIDFVSIISAILAILGLLLAIWQLYLAHQQSRDATRQANAISQMQSSLSTRYVGGLNEHFPKVIELVKNAKREIKILCDFPAYSFFSNHRLWVEYAYAIESQLEKGLPILLICPKSDVRIILDQKWFSSASQEWDNWKSKTQNSERVRNILRGRKDINIDDLTFEALVTILEKADQKAIDEVFAGATIIEVEEPVGNQIWIADETYSIFAFTGRAEKPSEYGFYTSDQKLISAFKELIELHKLN
jgi:hypothetical protein